MFDLPKETEILNNDSLKAEDIINTFEFHHRRIINIKNKIKSLKITNQIENINNKEEVINVVELLMPDIFKCNIEYLAMYYIPNIKKMVDNIYHKINGYMIVILKSGEKIANVALFKNSNEEIIYKLIDNKLSLKLPKEYENIKELYEKIIFQIIEYSDKNYKIKFKYTYKDIYKLNKGYELIEDNFKCIDIGEEIDEILERIGEDFTSISENDINDLIDIKNRVYELYEVQEITEKNKENFDDIFSYIEEEANVQLTD